MIVLGRRATPAKPDSIASSHGRGLISILQLRLTQTATVVLGALSETRTRRTDLIRDTQLLTFKSDGRPRAGNFPIS